MVGEGQKYATLAAALADAKEGDTIVLLSGEYLDEVKITINNLTIIGANGGIKFDGERSAETVLSKITLEKGVKNFTIDGVKSTSVTFLEINGDNTNVSVKNCIIGGTPTADAQSMIAINGNVSGLHVANSSFITTSARTQYRAIYCATGVITNAMIMNNMFKNDAKSSVYIDCIRIQNVDGEYLLENNTFDWPGDNWTVYFGSISSTENFRVDVLNNNFVSTTETMSGISINNLKVSATVLFMGNKFSKVGGTVVSISGTSSSDRTTTVTSTFRNNAFMDTSAKIRIATGLDNFTFDNNYVYTAINSSGNTVTPTNPAIDGNSALASVNTHNISYVLNNSLLNVAAPTSFVEGATISLDSVIPFKTDYKFMGWFDNANFTGEAITAITGKTADVVLYAKFIPTPIYTITYELDGGEADGLITSVKEGSIVTLPIPTKFGFTFLGWSLVKGDTTYITKITVKDNVVVYANFTDAEIYTVTYEFNGGNIVYKDLETIKADFDKDYRATTGQTDYSKWKCTADLGKVFTETNHKWDWLLDYWSAVNPKNASAFQQMKTSGTCSDYYYFGVEITCWYQSNQQSVYGGSLKSANYADYDVQNGFWKYLSAASQKEFDYQDELVLPTSENFYNDEAFAFEGWYLNSDFSGERVYKIVGDKTVFAKWTEKNPVTDISVTNMPEKMTKGAEVQLDAAVVPSTAINQNLKFESSDSAIVSVSSTGLLKAVNAGTAKITITAANGKIVKTYDITVQNPDNIDVSFAEGYTGVLEVNGQVQLNVSAFVNQAAATGFTFESLNTAILNVDANGLVTAVASGNADIKISLTSNPDLNITIGVYVKVSSSEEVVDSLLELLASNNNARVWYKNVLLYNASPYVYQAAYGSVNSYLFDSLVVKHDYALTEDAAKNAEHVGSKMTTVEFVTVHDTANPNGGAAANAEYFEGGGGDSSIHYVVGDDEIYDVVPESYVAYHAGDGTGTTFQWLATGVDAVEDKKPVITVSSDLYYVVNGVKTSLVVPTTGLYSDDSPAELVDKTENSFSQYGPAWKIIDGKYYIGTTWACFTQVRNGVICSKGGNNNSIGIESCVNKSGDVFDTWQRTAKLVADILIRNNLSIERVRQHNDFSGKNCPQSMRYSNYWDSFMKDVKLELLMQTTYKDCEVTLSSTSTIIDSTGRIVSAPLETTAVYYTITVKLNGVDKSVTLCSVVPGTSTWKQFTGSSVDRINF